MENADKSKKKDASNAPEPHGELMGQVYEADIAVEGYIRRLEDDPGFRADEKAKMEKLYANSSDT